MAVKTIASNNTMRPTRYRSPSQNPGGGINGWRNYGHIFFPDNAGDLYLGFLVGPAPSQPTQSFGSTICHRIGKKYGYFAVAFYPAPSALAPTVVSTAPNNGPAAGGTVSIVTGTNFIGATAVTFGGVSVTAFVVLSATQIRVVTQPHAAGAVDVQVTTPTGGTGTGLGVYTYT